MKDGLYTRSVNNGYICPVLVVLKLAYHIVLVFDLVLDVMVELVQSG